MIRDASLPDDRDGIFRAWKEVGWIGDGDRDKAALDGVLDDNRSLVVDVGKGVEAHACSHRGLLRHTQTDLPTDLVAAVVVGRTARRRGWGKRLTAELVRRGADEGVAAALLGVFDQGFYESIGFGMGAPLRFTRFDPSALRVPVPDRVPIRLGFDDGPRILANRLEGRGGHGAGSFESLPVQDAEMRWGDDDSFGLGFEDADGTLTHHVWIKGSGEGGPYLVKWMTWRTPQELQELFGVLKSLSDQILTMQIWEPAGLFLQDWLERPGRAGETRGQGKHRLTSTSDAWWAVRIVDLPACVAAVEPTEALRFGLELRDPLDELGGGPSLSGAWTLDLGDRTATRGTSHDLPTLRCDVATLSQLWLGSRSGAVLRNLGALEGPLELISTIDRALRLPTPELDWEV